MERTNIFETLSPTRLFIRCAVPSMVSMAVTSLYTVADGIFVGRFIGSDALAAINLVWPLIMISFALSDMIAVGSSVQIAIKLGEKDPVQASKIFSFCSALIVALSCVLGVLGYAFSGPLVQLLGADAVVTAYAVEYMRVYSIFAPAILIFFAVDNYLRICGKVHYSMVMNIVISASNIVLDALFIVVFKWGIGSAALASCLSLAAGTVIGYLPFFRGETALKFVRARLSLRMLGNILANGSSEFLSNISGSVLFLIINTVLLRLGGAMAVAAFSIVMYVDTVVKSLIYGMSNAMQPAIGYNYGAKNHVRIHAIMRRVFVVGAALSLSVLLLLQFGGKWLIPLFLTGGERELLTMSLRAMKLFSYSYLFCWFTTIVTSYWTAIDRPIYTFSINIGQTLLFPLVCLFAFTTFGLGLDGVWLTSLGANIITTIIMCICMPFALREKKSLRK